jgi:hypothetical protein
LCFYDVKNPLISCRVISGNESQEWLCIGEARRIGVRVAYLCTCKNATVFWRDRNMYIAYAGFTVPTGFL